MLQEWLHDANKGFQYSERPVRSTARVGTTSFFAPITTTGADLRLSHTDFHSAPGPFLVENRMSGPTPRR